MSANIYNRKKSTKAEIYNYIFGTFLQENWDQLRVPVLGDPSERGGGAQHRRREGGGGGEVGGGGDGEGGAQAP